MDLKTRIGVDNIDEDLMKRLIGASEKDTCGLSPKVRQCLDEALPPFEDVKIFYDKAVQKYRHRQQRKVA